jgi:hypothetical protein
MEPLDQHNTLEQSVNGAEVMTSSPPRKKIKKPATSKAAAVTATAAILPKVTKTVKVGKNALDQSGLKPSGQIIWTAPLLVLLLEIIIQVGAHIASGKATAIKWSEVHAIFFDSEECVQYKTEEFYKKDEYRKLKDKYTKVMKSISENISTGNQSGKSGEMTRVYELVQLIENEVDDDREEREERKQNAEDQHKAIEQCETDVLTKNTIRLIITIIIYIITNNIINIIIITIIETERN